MKTFIFEIQNCIKTRIMANTAEEARQNLIESLDDYGDQMVDGSCYVSNGEEVSL